jgi:NAD(P)-dependent dehydrogenase (short-subunit alcohol dehydrogenase family)
MTMRASVGTGSTSAEARVTLVTGAAGAIGSATVRAFLAAGFRVVGFDRDASVTDALADGYTGFRVDLEDEDALTETVTRASRLGQLAHVIGIAGGALPDEPKTRHDLAEVEPAVFRASIEANLTTQYLTLRAVLPWLRRQRGLDRSVALISSFNALAGWGMPAYSAAKAGLIGMMRALTGPLGAEGIRINVVAPGTVRTPRTERIWSDMPGHFEGLTETTALGRLGTPDDVARSFLVLATELTHVTGQVLVVDGGQTVKRG